MGIEQIYYLVFIVAIVLSIVAQAKVQNNFSKYSKVRNYRNLTGGQVARDMLDRNGLSDVRIERISGNLTDNYSPNEKILRLSDNVLNVASISAVAVAAHEVGHAIQDKEEYSPMKVRALLVPLANFGSNTSMIFIMIGLITSMGKLFDIGILLFSLAVIFYLITLPVEFDASSRALEQLSEVGYITQNEYKPAKSVLAAAALTYVASALSAISYLLRLLTIRKRRD